MKERFFHFSFWVPATLFLAHQIIQKALGYNVPFLDSYLDPFCFGALTLPLYSLERTILFKQEKLSFLEVFLLMLFLILISEIVLPHYSNKFVFDPYDILMILLGASWFWLIGPNTSKQNRNSSNKYDL